MALAWNTKEHSHYIPVVWSSQNFRNSPTKGQIPVWPLPQPSSSSVVAGGGMMEDPFDRRKANGEEAAYLSVDSEVLCYDATCPYMVIID